MSIYRPGEPLTVQPAQMPQPAPMPPQARLVLETPLRLRRGEHHVGPEDFRFSDLFSSLLRRVSMLTYFHTDTPLETDFAELVRRSKAVRLTAADLHWHDWTRFSSRQQTTMEMGGLLGAVELDLAGMDPFWPYLWLGQWTHAGKGTSMGLGKYRIEVAAQK